jgi:peptidylamidoglycolate lyase
MNRRAFIQDASIIMSGTVLTKPIGALAFGTREDLVIGHGDYRYKVNKEWGALDPNRYPVNDNVVKITEQREK